MPEHLQGDSLEASLTVKNLEHSAAWYCSTLGFSEDRRHERAGRLIAVSLKAGAVRILLTQDDGAKGLERAKGEGFSLQIMVAGVVAPIPFMAMLARSNNPPKTFCILQTLRDWFSRCSSARAFNMA